MRLFMKRFANLMKKFVSDFNRLVRETRCPVGSGVDLFPSLPVTPEPTGQRVSVK